MPIGDNRQTKNWLYSRWFLAGSIVLLVFLSISFARVWYAQHQVASEIDSLKQEAAELEHKKIETLDALKFAQTKEFVEEKARTELGLAEPGENVTIIATSAPITGINGQSGQSNSDMLKLANPSNLAKWWAYFFE